MQRVEGERGELTRILDAGRDFQITLGEISRQAQRIDEIGGDLELSVNRFQTGAEQDSA